MKKFIVYISLILPFALSAQNSEVKIPNVFSPNNDGINDQFIVSFDTTQQVKYLRITFYNRYGQIVHEREIPEMALKDNPHSIFYLWDGTTNAGVNVPEGTYFYIFTYQTTNATEEKTGTVSILR
jgi:gliding motility-associated-like protein